MSKSKTPTILRLVPETEENAKLNYHMFEPASHFVLNKPYRNSKTGKSSCSLSTTFFLFASGTTFGINDYTDAEKGTRSHNYKMTILFNESNPESMLIEQKMSEVETTFKNHVLSDQNKAIFFGKMLTYMSGKTEVTRTDNELLAMFKSSIKYKDSSCTSGTWNPSVNYDKDNKTWDVTVYDEDGSLLYHPVKKNDLQEIFDVVGKLAKFDAIIECGFGWTSPAIGWGFTWKVKQVKLHSSNKNVNLEGCGDLFGGGMLDGVGSIEAPSVFKMSPTSVVVPAPAPFAVQEEIKQEAVVAAPTKVETVETSAMEETVADSFDDIAEEQSGAKRSVATAALEDTTGAKKVTKIVKKVVAKPAAAK